MANDLLTNTLTDILLCQPAILCKFNYFIEIKPVDVSKQNKDIAVKVKQSSIYSDFNLAKFESALQLEVVTFYRN